MREIGTIKGDSVLGNENNTIKFSEIFRSLFEIKFDKRLLGELDYTYECYQDLMKKYDSLDDYGKKKLNEMMCYDETIMLHSTEISTSNEEKQLIDSLLDDDVRKDSIIYTCEEISKNEGLRNLSIKKLHSILIDGTASKKDENKKFREKDTYYVGYPYENGNVHVGYIPPLAKNIEDAMRMILVYLNDPELKKRVPNTYISNVDNNFDKKYSLFIQPLVVSALFVILQAFNDGNSRLSKVVADASIYNHTNQIFDKNYEAPLIYLAHGYYSFKENYRELIKDIALNPNSDTWSKWFMFSLHSIQSSINYYDEKINEHNILCKMRY